VTTPPPTGQPPAGGDDPPEPGSGQPGDPRPTFEPLPPPPAPAPGWAPGGQPPPGWGQPPPARQPAWGAAPPPGGQRRGPLPLRPLTLGDILDGAFRLFTANWRTLLIVAGVFLVPLQLVTAFLQRGMLGGMGFLDMLSDPTAAQVMLEGGGVQEQIATFLSGIASVFVLPLVAGAVSKVVAASYLGEQLPPGDALRATLRKWGALVGSWILVHLLQIAPLTVGVAMTVAGAVTGSAVLVVLGVLLVLAGLVAWLGIMALYVPTAPAIVIEDIGPLRGMGRAVRLTRPRFWFVLGVAVLSGMISGLVNGALAGIPTFVALFIGLEWGWLLLAAGSIVGGLVTTPFVAIVATLVYFDGRIRHEAFDLRIIAGELGRELP
jgi:hypothetical protein